MLVAVIALIVVGPKDLPMMMRKLGQFMAKGKAMAREFQSAFDDIARQAELDELRKEIEDIRRENSLTEAVDELKKMESDINRRVMMENPMPDASKGGAGAVPDKGQPVGEAGEAEEARSQQLAGSDDAPGEPDRIGPDATPNRKGEPEPGPSADKKADT